MNFWQEIAKPVIGLAPMDGVTDASFRFIMAKYGAPDVTFTEFVSVETAFHAPHSLIRDMAYCDLERPIVAQIYGHTPEMFYKLAHIVCDLGFDGLDINMGCPAKKVAAKGSGAGLIRTPDLARSIIRSVKRGIGDWQAGQTLTELHIRPDLIEQIEAMNQQRTGQSSVSARPAIPVSIKTRIGYDRSVIDDWIGTLLEEEPAAITIHGRTLEQQYRGFADWDAIARAAEIAGDSSTLILGNGDLRGMDDVYRRVREAKVDGVLLGRAAQGDPWIFSLKDTLKQSLARNEAMAAGRVAVPVVLRLKAMLEHAAHFAQHREPSAFVAMRKHLAWYCRAVPSAAALRAQIVRSSSFAEAVECVEHYLSRLERDPSGPRMSASPRHPLAPPVSDTNACHPAQCD